MSQCSLGSCREKRLRGNFFAHRADAKALRNRIKRQTGKHLDVFRCEWCGQYHVGKPFDWEKK